MKKTAVLLFAAAVLVAVPSQARAQSTFGPVAAFHDDAVVRGLPYQIW